MRRYNKYDFETNQTSDEDLDPRYSAALHQVKRIKKFYTHLLVYILVNGFIIFGDGNFFNQHDFWKWETFSTSIFWGIGLVFHAFSVFGKNIFFSSGWEERKINEFMEKEKDQKWE